MKRPVPYTAPPQIVPRRAALAGQFGVSSTPIRDALMRLEEKGLVDIFPQYATMVSRVDVRLAQIRARYPEYLSN